MILTIITYILLLVLFIWGAKFFGFKDKFDDNYLDKTSTSALAGFAAILIIIHHISQQDAFRYVSLELFEFVDLGFLITSIFLFNSGYGLTVSKNNNPDYLKGFFKKRILVVLIPFVISNIVFSIINIVYGGAIEKSILGAFGLVVINKNGWFPIVLIIMYLLFLFNQKYIKSFKGQIAIYLGTIILLYTVFIFNGHYAWWSGTNTPWISPNALMDKEWWQQMQVFLFSGEWWVNSAIAFVVGVVYGEYKEKIFNFFKKGYWIKLLVLFVLLIFTFKNYIWVRESIGYWTEYGVGGPGIYDKFITASSQFFIPVIFIVTLETLMMKVRIGNKVMKFMSFISYETYLYGVISIELFSFIINKYGTPSVLEPYNYNLAIYTVCVLISSIVIGFITNRIDRLIISKTIKK